jgi:hypothetical protein
MTHFVSNASVYKSIAEDANAEAQRLLKKGRMPKPDGSEGYIIVFDPSRRSFKQSLVAIAFSAIYFEALLFLVGTQTMGTKWKNKIDEKTYAEKLRELGVTDVELIASAERLRKSRKDLVHEKAVSVETLSAAELRSAQEEAASSVLFIGRITEKLQSAA